MPPPHAGELFPFRIRVDFFFWQEAVVMSFIMIKKRSGMEIDSKKTVGYLIRIFGFALAIVSIRFLFFFHKIKVCRIVKNMNNSLFSVCFLI